MAETYKQIVLRKANQVIQKLGGKFALNYESSPAYQLHREATKEWLLQQTWISFPNRNGHYVNIDDLFKELENA